MEWEKIKHFGKLSNNRKNIEFNYMSWDGNEKYDLRKWGDEGESPYKGITIKDHELPELYKLLIIAQEENKSTSAKHTIKIEDKEVKVFNVFGSFSTSGGWGKYVTYTAWGNEPKYDVRSWKTDFSQPGRGVTLSDNEIEILIKLIKPIVFPTEKSDETTKEVAEKVNTLSGDLFV